MIDKIFITNCIEKAKTAREICKRLDAAGILYADLTDEYGYMNLRIPVANGYIRVYRDHRGIVRVQQYEKIAMKWSGIPTFEPSGRRSI